MDIHGYIHTLCMHCTQKLSSATWKIVKKTFQSGQKAIQLEGNTNSDYKFNYN